MHGGDGMNYLGNGRVRIALREVGLVGRVCQSPCGEGRKSLYYQGTDPIHQHKIVNITLNITTSYTMMCVT